MYSPDKGGHENVAAPAHTLRSPMLHIKGGQSRAHLLRGQEEPPKMSEAPTPRGVISLADSGKSIEEGGAGETGSASMDGSGDAGAGGREKGAAGVTSGPVFAGELPVHQFSH